MTTIKIFKAAIIISILTLMIGCGDQVVNSGGDWLSGNAFHTKLDLIPGHIYILNDQNTGLSEFNELSILNHSMCNDDIEITAYFEDEATSLECNVTGFKARILMIENLTEANIEADITLKGIKAD